MRLDPNLERLYRDGVTFLTYINPEKAAELFERACENRNLRHSAEIPFYTGLLLLRYLEKPRYEDAAKYFRMAAMRDDGGKVQRTARHLHYKCLAHVFAEKNNIDERRALVEVLYNCIKSGNTLATFHEMRRLQAVPESEMLMRALQILRRPTEYYTPIKVDLDRATEIARNVFSEFHVCHECMEEFLAGDKFCRNCGKPVEVFGVCGKCGHLVENVRFCPECGTPVGGE